MLFVAHWLVIIVFWFFIYRLVKLDGIKLPATFAIFWTAGYFLFPLLGLEGGLYFISYGSILALILIYIDLTRAKLGLRNKAPNPLQAHHEEMQSGDNKQ